ncbi:MAG: DUF1552 domain-containing protein [Myxococcota bacterium]
MRYSKVMSRRTVLRGAGSVAIGLPLIDAMYTRSAWGGADIPDRVITVFFPQRLSPQMASNGFTGAMEPLAAVGSKLGMVNGLDGTGGGHENGAKQCFCGSTDSPSIDWVARTQLHPGGPPTPIGTLAAGTWLKRNRLDRYVRCWTDDRTPADLPQESPEALFDRLFGSRPDVPADDPATLKATRYEKSVLDSTIEQYKHFTSDASNLSVANRARIKDHLDKLREIEMGLDGGGVIEGCMVPDAPNDGPLLGGQGTDDGPVIVPGEWQARFRQLADIYAVGLECDVFRFGNLLFQGSGDRAELNGEFSWGDRQVSFNDTEDHHEYWHSNDDANIEDHTLFIMAQIGYFLDLLDAMVEPNGGTVLENSLVMLGTELGNASSHNMQSVFHAHTSARGRLRVGQVFDLDATTTDYYRTALAALDIDAPIGNTSQFNGVLDPLLQ